MTASQASHAITLLQVICALLTAIWILLCFITWKVLKR